VINETPYQNRKQEQLLSMTVLQSNWKLEEISTFPPPRLGTNEQHSKQSAYLPSEVQKC
jgi:hypothetical protein